MMVGFLPCSFAFSTLAFWRARRGKSLQIVVVWWKRAADAGNGHGVLGGPLGHFQKLCHLPRDEMRRAGMYWHAATRRPGPHDLITLRHK